MAVIDFEVAQARVLFLRKELEYHNQQYYQLDSPEITDAEYDALFRELLELEKSFPELDVSNSPTKRVGGRVADGFESARHTVPMLSLDNAMVRVQAEGQQELDFSAWHEFAQEKLMNAFVENVQVTVRHILEKSLGRKLTEQEKNRYNPELRRGIFECIVTPSGAKQDDFRTILGDIRARLGGANLLEIAGLASFDFSLLPECCWDAPARLLSTFWLDPKMDGLALEVIYKRKKNSAGMELVRAITRGDGQEGEVVTENMRTVRNLPLYLPKEVPGELLEVRGEVVMSHHGFQTLNRAQQEQGLKPFANSRNAAAGSIRQLNSAVTASRPLQFLAYGIGSPRYTEGGDFWPTQQELMHSLESFGFTIAPQAKLCKSTREVEEYFSTLYATRDVLPFEIDGVVAKLNDRGLQEFIAHTARAPRWAIALKFPAVQVQTTLLQVLPQVGRTGVLTPVAKLEAVHVGGVLISRATLHNYDEVKSKDLHIGDTVLLQRAGDVIPQIVSVLKEKRNGSEQAIVIPTACPVCGGSVSRSSDEVALRCTNIACPAQVEQALIHFVSKAGLDMEGVGKEWIKRLVRDGLVASPADLFLLQAETLAEYEGMGEKSSRNFIQALEKTKKTASLPRLIAALGIRHVGEQTARALAAQYYDLDALAKATTEELKELDDVGDTVAASITAWFANEANQKLLLRFKELGLWPCQKQHEQKVARHALFGKKFVFSGTLPIARNQAEQMVIDVGGEIMKAVSSRVDYLVAGTGTGSKMTKATALGLHIIDYENFLILLQSEGSS